MPGGRIIRINKRGVSDRIAYIVAVGDPTEATELIRQNVGVSDDAIEDLGRVSNELLRSLNLKPGELVRADDPRVRGGP